MVVVVCGGGIVVVQWEGGAETAGFFGIVCHV
jgi:hypothetical protein